MGGSIALNNYFVHIFVYQIIINHFIFKNIHNYFTGWTK